MKKFLEGKIKKYCSFVKKMMIIHATSVCMCLHTFGLNATPQSQYYGICGSILVI